MVTFPAKRLPFPIWILTILALLLSLTVATTSPVAAATPGALIVTGHDLDEHCPSGSGRTISCVYFKLLLDLTRNGTLPVLALDQGTEVAASITIAYGTSAPTVVTVDPTTPAFTTLPLVDARGAPLYSALVTASDSTCGGCDNTPAGEAAINARAADIARFNRAGGGILALSGASNSTLYYQFLPLPVTGLPGGGTNPYSPTSYGASLGITSTMTTGTNAHSHFQVPAANYNTAETNANGDGITLVTQVRSAASVSPSTVYYGDQQAGTTSAAQTVTLTNTGALTITVSGVTLTGANPGDFVIASNGCPAGTVLAPGASCGVSVQFKPTATGNRTAQLTFTSDAGNSPQSATLTGTGTTTPAPPPPPPGWSDWTSLGGILTDAPAATDFQGQLYVFARGSDNALYVTASANGSTWTGWRSLGGILTAAPAATSFNGQLYVFAKGSDNALYVQSSADGVTFSGWTRLGGVLTAPPAATSFNGRLVVFARGINVGTASRPIYPLWVLSSSDGMAWTGWSYQGGNLTAAPAATSFGGQLYVFAKGSDNALYLKASSDGVSFSEWQNLGGILTAAPAAASYTPPGGMATLYTFATGTDNTLYERHSTDGVTWTGWVSLGGELVGPPAAAGVLGQQRLYAVVRWRDNSLWLLHTTP